MRRIPILRWAGATAAVLAFSSVALTACTPAPNPSRGNWQPPGAALVRLARPVSGVNQDGLLIRERDSGRLVPATLLCKSGDSDVDCSGSRISSIWVLPTQALVFGQYYRISFAARLLDAQHRPPITGNADFRAGKRAEDQGSAAMYTWAARGNPGAWGGSYVVESMKQARASLTFTGRSVTVWTATSPTGGLMDVYIDRRLRRTIDTYSARTRFRVPVTAGGLTPSGHRLDVVVRGSRGSSSSRGTDVVIDGVSSQSGSLPNPAFEYGWGTAIGSAYSSGMASVSVTSGATVSLVFREPASTSRPSSAPSAASTARSWTENESVTSATVPHSYGWSADTSSPKATCSTESGSPCWDCTRPAPSRPESSWTTGNFRLRKGHPC